MLNSNNFEEKTQTKHCCLHIISWNVAGWSKTVKGIREKHGSLSNFLSKLKVDILALQETKPTDKTLTSSADSFGCGIEVREPQTSLFESFWNSCTKSGSVGFNGVATFARRGLTYSANRTILENPDLDTEGRCIVTDHGKFVLFNVYIPNASSTERLHYKCRYLAALRSRIQEIRSTGKQVILCGDLNISYRPIDQFYEMPRLDLHLAVHTFPATRHPDPIIQAFLLQLQNRWSIIREFWSTMMIKPVKTTNTATNELKDRFRIICKTRESKSIILGPPYQSEEEARHHFPGLEAMEAHAESMHNNWISMGFLFETLSKLFPTEDNMQKTKLIPLMQAFYQYQHKTREVHDNVENLLVASGSSHCISWLHSLLHEDGMVDTFRALYPLAEGRFTVWHQYKNRRYENEGTRIDYFLLDASLAKLVIPGQESLYGASHLMNPEVKEDDSLTFTAAKQACVAYGRWKMAPFGGGGLEDGTKADYETQFYPPHTGIVYFAPKFSDHVGVSVLLSLTLEHDDGISKISKKDIKTLKCQPHRKQQSIKSLFASSSSSATASGNPPPRAMSMFAAAAAATVPNMKRKSFSNSSSSSSKSKKKKKMKTNSSSIKSFFGKK